MVWSIDIDVVLAPVSGGGILRNDRVREIEQRADILRDAGNSADSHSSKTHKLDLDVMLTWNATVRCDRSHG
jgi:hypothetical protein